MKIQFNSLITKTGEIEPCMTVSVSGDPENCTLEFSDEDGTLSSFKKNLLAKPDEPGKAYYSEIEIRIPGSAGHFDSSKLEHWKLAEDIWRGTYFHANIIEK